MENKYIMWFVVGIVVVVGAVVLIANYSSQQFSSPYNLQAFVQCLNQKGAKFYGAFWCPHCQATKKLFGPEAKNLPYVECSTPDAQGQLQVCKDKEIEGYPTWIFADNTRLSGETTFEQLSQKSGCPLLPAASSTPQ